jgi:sec-independent protein translocase protein TatA
MSPLLAMFGIGMQEMIIVMVIVLVLFGHRLPSVMRSMGRGIKEFKEGVNDSTSDDDLDELDEKPKKKSQEDTVNH